MVERLTIDGVGIEQIPVQDVKTAYQLIEYDLKRIKRKSYSDWIPADVYVALLNKQATLFMFYDSDNYVGFIVTSIIHDTNSKETLFVWASYQKPEYNYTEVGFKFLDKLAYNKNIEAIEFHTSRPGWERVATKYGFELTSYIYKKEV